MNIVVRFTGVCMENSLTIGWEQFLDACRDLSKISISSDSIESALADLFSALDCDDTTLHALFSTMDTEPYVDYRTLLPIDEDECRVMLIVLQAGTKIGLHNHPKQTGSIFCIEGNLTIEAYDEYSAHGLDAVLEKSYGRSLGPDEHAFLSPERANIHSLYGEEKSFLIDVFIPWLKSEYEHLCRRYQDPYRQREDGKWLAKIIPKSS